MRGWLGGQSDCSIFNWKLKLEVCASSLYASLCFAGHLHPTCELIVNEYQGWGFC